MGSVQHFGEKCPCCGHNSIFEDYYYKTQEMYLFCKYCGYSYKNELQRDAENRIVWGLDATFDLRNDFLFVGAATIKEPMDDPKSMDEFVTYLRVSEGMTESKLVEEIKRLNEPAKQCATLFRKQQDGKIERLGHYMRKITIDGATMQIEAPVRNVSESQGYGVAYVQANGIGHNQPLKEGDTIETVLGNIDLSQTEEVKIVVFSPAGQNPQFYGTTEEEWFASRCDVSAAEQPEKV